MARSHSARHHIVRTAVQRFGEIGAATLGRRDR